MAVDKNLFLHDLAIVAIMKCEGPYLKEWLDYHLLAGVDHFYLYDNESPDNQAEVAAPYIEAGLVDYIPAPGKLMHYVVCNDAVNKFKFQSRYMAFIDGDEFIYPKSAGGERVIDIVDEVFSAVPNAGELSISWQCFGSNGQEKADYSRGVLERFTMRESKDKSPTKGCKCIADPRKIHHIESPHWVALFEGFVPVTEDGKVKTCNRWILEPQFTDKIVVNHYRCMSWEEYAKRAPRGDASAHTGSKYSREFFKKVDLNDEFDDGILKYRDARAENFSLESNEQKLNRVTDSLIETLSSYAGGKIFDLETTLTCLALSRYMREKFPNDSNIWETCEKTSLEAVLKSIGDLSIAEAQLLIHELPNLLTLPYPVVNELREVCLHIISQMMDIMRLNNRWKDYVELDYIQRLLKIQK